MNKKFKALTLLTSGVLFTHIVASKIRETKNRSVRSELIDNYYQLMNMKSIYQSPDKFENYIYEKANENKKAYKLTRYMMSHVEESTFESHQIFTLTSTSKEDYYILYLHGDDYTNQPTFSSWSFCDKLCKELNAKVFIPMYPLAPSYNHEDAYSFIEKFYDSIPKDKPLLLVGTSSGGGFATGFCEYLGEYHKRKPEHLILISPWLDITLSNKKIDLLDDIDPILSPYGLKKIGLMWAGSKSTYAYKVSPIHGDVRELVNVTLVVGENELFYPDVLKFHDMLKEHKINTHLIIGKNMNHNYPLLPIREAKDTLKQIVSIINHH